MSTRDDIEKRIQDALEESDIREKKPEETAVRKLPPKYEIRQMVTLDPIVEETRRVRKIAQEVDGRYDKYMERAQRAKKSDEG
ncbi:hypothetical protein ABNC92_19025 [Paenibacillus larvae]